MAWSKLQDVAHIGIAVENLENAKALYCETFGLECREEKTIPERGVRIALLETKNICLELLEGIGEDSPVSKFVSKRGPGVHHLCFETEDIEDTLEKLDQAGIRLIDQTARPGAEGKLVAFLHPSSTHGVLIEIQEK
jgi:methylmalonyl-CoA epimerase